jgi:hypothetical protein
MIDMWYMHMHGVRDEVSGDDVQQHIKHLQNHTYYYMQPMR